MSVNWPTPVNLKNASRVFEAGKILNAFKARGKKIKRFSNLNEVTASTARIWRMTSRDYTRPATASFRSHLNWMKKQELIIFEEESKVWRLTSKGMELVVNE